ncbi:beta-lactamase family protein [Streptomyces bingchenggensis BCW-1]|uniref:Beta-lactamase family protein n=1 Tax=Streptomyces bingchenggensis (strain BCW-1) TaxID=749414 RepID=D7BR39_STRBB|nr:MULTISPECIES: serine hydrolase domain-containing protein [Streptomyces]ADI11389.1 beta-lactamase family protein [Streptomyces bingchenggensis BCW-1]
MTTHTPTGALSDGPAAGADHLLAPAVVRRATGMLLSAAPGASAIAVGLHREGRRALVVRGHVAHHSHVPADADTRFEAGSLTKTFTALLLAEQAARGDLGHHDPLARHLPAATRLPLGGAAITLTHLATHTSGLPRLPPGLLRSAAPLLFTNPYAAFTPDDVLRALARTRLRATPGSRVRYSNFGLGLLGHALTGAAGGTPYPALLDARVLRPLGLRDTGCATSAAEGGAQATGYWYGRARPPFRIPGLPAAGALRTSARDLLALVEAILGPVPAPAPAPAPASAAVPGVLRTALSDVTRPRVRLPNGRGLSLVWNIRRRPDGSDLYHHSGATRGFTAFAGFNPRHATALVALANAAPGPGNALVQEAYNALIGLQG